jgi:hypothetical protein
MWVCCAHFARTLSQPTPEGLLEMTVVDGILCSPSLTTEMFDQPVVPLDLAYVSCLVGGAPPINLGHERCFNLLHRRWEAYRVGCPLRIQHGCHNNSSVVCLASLSQREEVVGVALGYLVASPPLSLATASSQNVNTYT